jgi:hypothetical protein
VGVDVGQLEVPSDSAWQPDEGTVVGWDKASPGDDHSVEVTARRDNNGKLEIVELHAHPEYVLDGTSSTPVGFDAPEDDAAFGNNGS